VRAGPDSVFAALAPAMIGRIVQWNRGAGFAVVRDEWLRRAFGLGKTVRIALPEGEREGRFDTIDEAGRLVLRRADGAAETVTAGDVLPAPAKA
jgi:BirA family biotin operon repressor/biotin-[acetyl-CoA-carboxylase] ligase